jgi:hypothetical protein
MAVLFSPRSSPTVPLRSDWADYQVPVTGRPVATFTDYPGTMSSILGSAKAPVGERARERARARARVCVCVCVCV